MASKGKKVKESIKSKNNKVAKIDKKLDDTKISDIPVIDVAHLDTKFNRRKLLSNWSKYDEDTNILNVDSSCSTGKDFTTVLQSSEKVNFKYQYQNIYEDFATNEGIPELDNNFLSLDLNYVSALLDCIPLHERYGLPEDIFEAEEIANFTSDAMAAEKKFKGQYSDEKSNIKTKSTLSLSNNNDFKGPKNSDIKLTEWENYGASTIILTNSSNNLIKDINDKMNSIIDKQEMNQHKIDLSSHKNEDTANNSDTSLKLLSDDSISIDKNLTQINEFIHITPKMNLDFKSNLNNINKNCDIKNDEVNIEALEAELELFLNF